MGVCGLPFSPEDCDTSPVHAVRTISSNQKIGLGNPNSLVSSQVHRQTLKSVLSKMKESTSSASGCEEIDLDSTKQSVINSEVDIRAKECDKYIYSFCENGDMMGLLSKLSPSWFRGWQQRVVLLQDRKLKWFKFTFKPSEEHK